jgi:cytoskeletal protein CcmA (bactofilin family)
MGNHSEANMSSNNKTVLGPDCKISGELSLDSDAVIMGQFKGTLRISGMLELTDSAKVGGTIIAGMVRTSGTAAADIAAEGGVELLPGAKVEGQIYTTQLSIVEGATFQGDVCIGPNAMQAAGTALQTDTAIESHVAGNHGRDHDDHDSLDLDESHDESPVKTVSSNVSSILQRRRTKVLTAPGMQPRTMSNGGNGHNA